jgi:hypothetical protein
MEAAGRWRSVVLQPELGQNELGADHALKLKENTGYCQLERDLSGRNSSHNST